MQPLLEVEGLKKTYPGFQLNGVSFSIYEDCITGFIGANGAGKTTTIRSILHLISHEAGTIKFKGKDISKTEKSFSSDIAFHLQTTDKPLGEIKSPVVTEKAESATPAIRQGRR